MSKVRFYFREYDDERCYLKKQIIEDMKEEGINELKIYKAKMVVGELVAYCSKLQDIIETDRGDCGKKWCEHYEPRNGKNGRCRFSNNCYEHTDEFEIIKLKP